MMDLNNIPKTYSSNRLIYRALENNEQDTAYIFKFHENDPFNTALSDHSLLRPRNKKSSEDLITAIQKASLSVMVCLSPSEAQAQDIESSDPVPIGFAILGWGGIPAGREHHRSTSLGITLSDPYQGKGYGSEVINWLLDWAFRYGGYHRVGLSTVAFNTRAQHVYSKLGFKEEGREREAVYFDRAWHDMINYSMLEHEWAALRGVK